MSGPGPASRSDPAADGLRLGHDDAPSEGLARIGNREREATRTGGRRNAPVDDRRRGRYVRALPATGELEEIALDATIRAAAPWQLTRRTAGGRMAIRSEDLQRKHRVAPRSTTIVFVVDASWSMAVTRRMRAARGAILGLLGDAYLRRDRVGLITFRGQRAVSRLEPTGAVALARRALRDLPVGGKTPLAAALIEASRMFRREALRRPGARALMVLLTDGAANVSVGQAPPLEEAWYAADRLRGAGIRSVVIDAEQPHRDRGLARALADHLNAPAIVLADLRADLLYRAVRRALDQA